MHGELRWPTSAYFGRLLLLYGLIAVATGLVAFLVITAIAQPLLAVAFVAGGFAGMAVKYFSRPRKLSQRVSELLHHPA
jgi:hypothetical protein